MTQRAERLNFLRKCWQTHHWGDGARELAQPVNYVVYRVRRLLGPHRPKYPHIGVAPSGFPEFAGDIAAAFADRTRRPALLDGLDGLWADADAQLKGVTRLAGGRHWRAADLPLERLPDVEDRHAYHRLYWAARLAQAAATRRPHAAETLTRDLRTWLEHPWGDDPIVWWPYTVSERIASLAEVLFWIGDGPIESARPLAAPIKRHVWEAARHLAANVERDLGLHNHILNNARALFLAGRVLRERDAATAWRDQAFAIWDECFPALVLPDGTFTEQSSHYHLLLCRTALEYWLAARRAERALPADLAERLPRMFQLANDLLRCDGTLPRFGDSSPDHVVADLWGLPAAAYAAGVLSDSPRHRAITLLTLYYCGVAPDLPPATASGGWRLYPDGGFAILRCPSLDVELAAHGDPRPIVAAHGDSGRGSFEVWRAGTVLIREPGNLDYQSGAEQTWFRSAAGQNVTALNGLDPNLPADLPRDLQKRLPAWYLGPGGRWECVAETAMAYTHEAFGRLATPATVRREWRLEHGNRLILQEDIHGSGRVRFATRLHLGDAPWQQIDERTFHCGALAEMTVTPPTGSRIYVQAAPFAPEYGVRRDGLAVCLEGTLDLPGRWSVQWEFPD